ncbi:MAG: gliding motility-associated C-terminal domain-containing protein [Bacteroidota bacterium]|nr:gliding motility-associated C-terminal domain-containing protein [Bacteroidota bacterium]
MVRILATILFAGMGWWCVAQPTDGLVAYYSFDACDATEDTGSGADGIIMGNATCGCGVQGSGLRFDGNTTVQILGNFDFLFASDFTLSFFILPEPTGTQTMDILSKSEICGIDSTMDLRYNPTTRDLSLTLSQQVDLSARASYRLPVNRCYHHIVFVKRQRELLFFYDGVQVDLRPSAAIIQIINNGILTLGGGPCLANGEVNFRGVLDELRFYSRALANFEIQQLYLPIDQITTPDTILFTGTSMQVRLPITCAPSVQWTPGTGVSNVNIAQPILNPVVTTIYSVALDYGFCQATDSLLVTVADSSDLTCDKIFFPTAFTPNGDNINEDWGLSNIVFLGQFVSLEVFDRWGGSVFFSTTPDIRWDGSYKGEQLMPNQYVYQFTYRCGEEERRKRGSVVILK